MIVTLAFIVLAENKYITTSVVKCKIFDYISNIQILFQVLDTKYYVNLNTCIHIIWILYNISNEKPVYHFSTTDTSLVFGRRDLVRRTHLAGNRYSYVIPTIKCDSRRRRRRTVLRSGEDPLTKAGRTGKKSVGTHKKYILKNV